MRKKFQTTSNQSIIRDMRPYQREAAELIISDVLKSRGPESIDVAIKKYRDQLTGYDEHNRLQVNDGKGLSGDIRDIAIYFLIKNGFAKAKAVTLNLADETLAQWSKDKAALEDAARLEFEFGSLRSVEEMVKEMGTFETRGHGEEAVYLYTDSLLDQLGGKYTKIGRHNNSNSGLVALRVFSQYGTGNPGKPKLRAIISTDNAVDLETKLHQEFIKSRVKDGVGKEWFAICYLDVLKRFDELQSQSST